MPQRAALPHIPYWWPVLSDPQLEAVPLLWYNEVDGAAIGAAAHQRIGPADVWWGIGFGARGDGGTPAGIEVAARVRESSLTFRSLHGRNAITVWSPGFEGPRGITGAVGISALWMSDERYLEFVPLFDCPSDAPAVPCDEIPTPYTWSDERDHAAELALDWGARQLNLRFVANAAAGLEAVGSEETYLRAELVARLSGTLRTLDWWGRLVGGWASGRTPRQRRFLLEGADPITRWLNPYLETREAVLAEIPYFVRGGPHLRGYGDTRPLVKRYVGAAAEVSREHRGSHGFWGRVGAFVEGAWTPGIPDRLGPEQLTPDSPLLFDWRELPVGEGAELGQFRARRLSISELWADGGVALTGGYRRFAITVSFPIWTSKPAFAAEPLTGGDNDPFALRWALTVSILPAAPED